MDTNNPDLETFRKQWQEEVTARLRAKEQALTSIKARASLEKPENPTEKVALPPSDVPKEEAEPIDGISTQAYHDLENKEEQSRLGIEGSTHHLNTQTSKEPKSALEHYEKAIEREDQGNLGDSLKLYRQAFRLDAGVDRVYKHKHFPPSGTKIRPADPNTSNSPVTVLNTAHHSLDGPSNISTAQLIASFSDLSIPSAPPPTEGSPPPPCPIAGIPLEILIDILFKTAIIDIAAFARLSLVCKRLAYLVATEDRVWERICHGHGYGFAAMHYTWAISITGQPLPTTLQTIDLPTDDSLDISTLTLSHNIPFSTIHTPPLTLSSTYSSYKQMFRTRPRIRFNGCYISTVNYHRPGASNAPSNATYTSPVHIVTYYRYLRFFRDGTCVSLLTTAEPADVVHHLTKENIHSHHNRESMLPSAVMRHALRGRWRLSGNLDSDSRSSGTKATNETEAEGDVHLETEGVDPKYMYKMHLALRTAGRSGGTRNNKLVWKGFWSYNRLTDDWAAFTLRNDRAFFWSRVRSYGMAW
ncbi:MAG: hypothetical protein LQ343_006377 [Gyalolechia ehrenbergii]|nr:MAG: hypothetical protein LQ343_006377 [Gyalolechia ehrenbergii]